MYTRKNTFKVMDNLFNNFNDIFSEFNDFSYITNTKSPLDGMPSYKFFTSDNKSEKILEMALPGVNESDVSVDVEEDVLSIEYNTDENNSFVSNFSKKFKLFKDVDKHKINADFKNGVLTVTLPLTRESRFSKKIM